ncbi:hypothetical protein Tco_1024882 [Tanacetum coccineum]
MLMLRKTAIIKQKMHSSNKMNLLILSVQPVQEITKSSSRNISKPVQTRRQLAMDPEMCMFALTVSTAEPKNIKEAMADSAWIEAMQEELHLFDRLQVWELVDKPFGKTGNDFEESFSLVARLEAAWIFVAYTAHKSFLIATAFYTQNRSILIPTHEKTAYHIINDRKPSIRHLHIFSCTCYLTIDGENLDKMKENKYPCILASDYDNSDPALQLQNVSPSAYTTTSLKQELDLLFGTLYDEFFTAGTLSVNKSSSPTDNSTQQDTPPTTNIQPLTEPITLTTIHAEENNNNQAADTQFQQDDFINPFCTLVREVVESSSHNIDLSNMHTFYQPHDSDYQWTKDHPLEQVHGNPSKPV